MSPQDVDRMVRVADVMSRCAVLNARTLEVRAWLLEGADPGAAQIKLDEYIADANLGKNDIIMELYR